MLYYKKLIALSLLALFVSISAFSDDDDDFDSMFISEDLPAEDDSFDDLDELFNNVSDTEEPVQTEPEKKLGETDVKIGTFVIPVEFSGKLTTSFGLAGVRKEIYTDVEPQEFATYAYENTNLVKQNTIFVLDKSTFEDYIIQKYMTNTHRSVDNDGTLYFSFTNYIYFSARPDKYLAFKGSVKTDMTDDDEAEEDGQNQYLYLYEMYFDYLFMNKIYITAGKKKTTWGNIRLFSDSKSYSDTDTDALYTNILYDSRKCISGIVKIPVGMHTFTAVALYDGSGDSIGTKNMSLAASAEFVFKGTSVNFFGRRFPVSSDSDTSDLTSTLSEIVAAASSSTTSNLTDSDSDTSTDQQHILGAELKTTILGFDIYGQSIARVKNYKKLKTIFTSHGSNVESLSKIVSTVGFYKLWSDNFPYFGINCEYQNIHVLNVSHYEKTVSTAFDGSTVYMDARDEWGRKTTTEDWKNRFTNRIAVYAGFAKLGPSRNIKTGIQWNHDFSNNVGFVQPGIIISRVLPHCDLNIGAKYEYYDINSSSTVTSYKSNLLYPSLISGYTTKQTVTFAQRITLGAYFTVSLDY